jgi:hypothetical protein
VRDPGHDVLLRAAAPAPCTSVACLTPPGCSSSPPMPRWRVPLVLNRSSRRDRRLGWFVGRSADCLIRAHFGLVGPAQHPRPSPAVYQHHPCTLGERLASLGGLRESGGMLTFVPRLPQARTRLALNLRARDMTRPRIEVERTQATCALLAGGPLDMDDPGEAITITAHQPVQCPIAPKNRLEPPTRPGGRAPRCRRVPAGGRRSGSGRRRAPGRGRSSGSQASRSRARTRASSGRTGASRS